MPITYSNPVYEIIYEQFIAALSAVSNSLYVNNTPYIAQTVSTSVNAYQTETCSLVSVISANAGMSVKTGSLNVHQVSDNFSLYVFNGTNWISASLN